MKKSDFGVLWKAQYAPREKLLLGVLGAKEKKMWGTFSLPKKIRLIDEWQAKGVFE